MKFANLVIQLREIKKKYNIDHCVRYRYDECKYRYECERVPMNQNHYST